MLKSIPELEKGIEVTFKILQCTFDLNCVEIKFHGFVAWSNQEVVNK